MHLTVSGSSFNNLEFGQPQPSVSIFDQINNANRSSAASSAAGVDKIQPQPLSMFGHGQTSTLTKTTTGWTLNRRLFIFGQDQSVTNDAAMNKCQPYSTGDALFKSDEEQRLKLFNAIRKKANREYLPVDMVPANNNVFKTMTETTSTLDGVESITSGPPRNESASEIFI